MTKVETRVEHFSFILKIKKKHIILKKYIKLFKLKTDFYFLCFLRFLVQFENKHNTFLKC
jgi:hypothetical protein